MLMVGDAGGSIDVSQPGVPPLPRRAASPILPEALRREARAMGVDVSQACERGLVAEVAARRRRWLEENGAAMRAWDAPVGRHGLPLAACRAF